MISINIYENVSKRVYTSVRDLNKLDLFCKNVIFVRDETMLISRDRLKKSTVKSCVQKPQITVTDAIKDILKCTSESFC